MRGDLRELREKWAQKGRAQKESKRVKGDKEKYKGKLGRLWPGEELASLVTRLSILLFLSLFFFFD